MGCFLQAASQFSWNIHLSQLLLLTLFSLLFHFSFSSWEISHVQPSTSLSASTLAAAGTLLSPTVSSTSPFCCVWPGQHHGSGCCAGQDLSAGWTVQHLGQQSLFLAALRHDCSPKRDICRNPRSLPLEYLIVPGLRVPSGCLGSLGKET